MQYHIIDAKYLSKQTHNVMCHKVIVKGQGIVMVCW